MVDMSFSVIAFALSGVVAFFGGLAFLMKALDILSTPLDWMLTITCFAVALMNFAAAELANALVSTARNGSAMLTVMEEQTELLRRLAGVSQEVAASEEEENTDET
jgi:hypothetical protein